MNITIILLTLIISVIIMLGWLIKVQRVFENPFVMVTYENLDEIKEEIKKIYNNYSKNTNDELWMKAIQRQYYYTYSYYQMKYSTIGVLVSFINFIIFMFTSKADINNAQINLTYIILQTLILFLFCLISLFRKHIIKRYAELRFGAFLLLKQELEDSHIEVERKDISTKT